MSAEDSFDRFHLDEDYNCPAILGGTLWESSSIDVLSYHPHKRDIRRWYYTYCTVCGENLGENRTYCEKCWFRCFKHEIMIQKRNFKKEWLESGEIWMCSKCVEEYDELMTIKQVDE